MFASCIRVSLIGFLIVALVHLTHAAPPPPVGSNMSNPIDAGTYNVLGTFTFTDTKNNATANGYGNDYGQASDDIFYRIIIQGTAQVDISHCGSGIYDSYVHLLNGDGSLRDYRDDNGPLCSGLHASLRVTLPAGTYYIVSEGYYNNSGNITTAITVTVQSVPPVSARNFIRTWDGIKPLTDQNTLTISTGPQEARIGTAYFDGLGRPEQTVIKQGSLLTGGSPTDLVTPVFYDDFGRETKKYLPYAAATDNGLYKENSLQEQNTFMQSQYGNQGETYFYAETVFEPSPLNRVTKTLVPGNSWVGNNVGVETQYLVNTEADDVRIWTIDFSLSAVPTAGATPYPTGALYKNVTVDERQKKVIEYKDKEGRVILKKVQLSDAPSEGHIGWLCTYYIYDDLGQLRYVLQPKAVEQIQGSWTLTPTVRDDLCFYYHYDERGRMIVKKVPGAAEVRMVYDARDRLVLTQDGVQRQQQKWLYTQYENDLNRPVATGLITDPANYDNHLYHRQ